MPQDDDGGGGDRKITCETVADDDAERPLGDEEEVEKQPDLPPESFWLSKDAEFDWFDRNAFYERKDSGKGSSNSTNLNPNLYPNPALNSSSQRFSMNLKSKASIIGLPKTQKASYVDPTKRPSRPANVKLFPKRSESAGKPVAEPSSPKVSCMGRVRSKRGRKKRSERPASAAKPAEKARSGEGRRDGIYRRFMSIFRSKPAVKTNPPPPAVESPPRKSVTIKARDSSVSVGSAAEPPGLGGMMRLASGRRSSASWGADDWNEENQR